MSEQVHGSDHIDVAPPKGAAQFTEDVEMACDWTDFRADYGVSANRNIRVLEHRAFCAGWLAARHGTDRGVLR